MKVKVYFRGKDNKPMFSCVFSEKQKVTETDFQFIERVVKIHEEELFDKPVGDTGISRIKTIGSMKSSFRKEKEEYDWGTNPVVFGESRLNGERSDIFMGVDIVPEGWYIRTTNAETGEQKFFKKINKRTVNTTAKKPAARLYQTLADLKKELVNKENTIIACAIYLGWKFDLVPANDEFKADFDATKRTKSEQQALDEINRILSAANERTGEKANN